ncbi:MAG: hypothetical protein QOH26_305 [Actinomycetota bacterium]|nr:hypothetical protein [Actinomycetota bacterium]
MIPADETATFLFAAAVGAATAQLLVRFRLQAPPKRLMRTNVAGRSVPAVLGGPLVISALLALLCVAVLAGVGWEGAGDDEMAIATSILLAAMGAAGAWDDHRGDEAPRGFAGHLGALRGRAVTGGLVKAVAGASAGLAAGWVLKSDLGMAIQIALLVALTANLVNLLDRAPGRAGKVSLGMAIPLVVWGSPAWAVTAGGLVGALAVCLVFDLAEKAMLGDAGANPVGAVLGLGLATALPVAGRIAAIVVLLALNLASERWSFSEVIERTPWMRYLDRAGRRRP